LIEGRTDVAALVLVFDYDEAEEAASGSEAGAHGIDLGEHAVEDEGHVVVFGKLEDGEHAADRGLGGRRRILQWRIGALRRCATQNPKRCAL